MASIIVKVPQGFPVGTTLSVYVDRVGDIVPQGTPVSTALIASDSTVTLTGLSYGIPYQAGAVIGGVWRSFLVEIPPPNPTTPDEVRSELIAHEIDTTEVHGIADTALVLTSGLTGGGTVGVPLSADTPDKLLWLSLGNALVELWGQRTPAGSVLAHSDDFSSLSPNYTHWSYWNNAWVNGGQFKVGFGGGGAADLKSARLDWGPISDTDSMSCEISATGGSYGRVGFVKQFVQGAFDGDYSHSVYIGPDLSAGGVVRLRYGTGQTDVMPAGTVVSGVMYRYSLARSGNDLIWSVTRVSDGVLIGSGTVNIPAGANRTDVGGGVTLDGVLFAGQASSPQAMVMDNLLHYQQQAEQRDLFVAITPNGGVRTVKRLFGAIGAATLRSDFADKDSPSFTGTVGLPTYTTATRPTPASVGNGRMIYVSDAAAGSNVQVTVAGAWVGIG